LTISGVLLLITEHFFTYFLGIAQACEAALERGHWKHRRMKQLVVFFYSLLSILLPIFSVQLRELVKQLLGEVIGIIGDYIFF
jgi:hypothetical protein